MEKKQLTFKVDSAIIKKLKFLAVERDKSLTALFLGAVEDLLKKHQPQKK